MLKKLKTAINEHRLLKTAISYVAKILLPEKKYLIIYNRLDYIFGRKDLQEKNREYLQISSQEKNEKITIVFVIWMVEMWNSLRAVYETACNNPLMNVFIIAQPHISDVKHLKGQNPAYTYLKKLYGEDKVIDAHKNGEWFELKNLKPNYVFYTYPYEYHYYDLYKSKNVSNYAKVCLIQYGYTFQVDTLFYVGYNFEFSKNVAIQFAANETTKKNLAKLYKTKKSYYPKITNYGYPLFDLVKKEKTTNQKQCILWTPRWTTPDQKFNMQSSFLKYVAKFIDFSINNSDVEIIIRPHPRLFENFISKGIMTKQEIEDFKNKCKNIKNLELDENSDYIPSVNKATIIVSDYSALLAEYFIKEKPVIYCDGNKGFTKEALLMDSSFYHARNWDDIEGYINNLLNGHDDLKQKRKALLTQFLPNGNNKASENIINFIQQDYYRK